MSGATYNAAAAAPPVTPRPVSAVWDLTRRKQMFQTSTIPVVVFLSALGLGACSALIDVSGQQCENASDCQRKQLGDACIDHVCVELAAQTTSDVQGGLQSGVLESVSSNAPCTRDSDCDERTPRCMRGTCVSAAVADLFLCRQPEDPPIDAEPVSYSFKVIEFVTRMPPGNIAARACQSNDVTCSKAIEPRSIDPDTGVVAFDLPRGFKGFFEVTSDAIGVLSYLTKPILVDTVDRDLQVSSETTFRTLAELDGAEVDMSKGIALLEAFDCTGMPQGGVHFEASSQGVRPFYIVNHVPNHDVTVSVLDEDNNVADGGFLNIEPGFVTFTARYGVEGPVLGEYNVAVRAYTFTFIDMYF